MQHRDAFQPACIDQPTERVAAHDERCKKRCENTERKRNRKTPYRSSRLPEQNNCSDQRRDVCVKDRTERFLISSVERYLERFSESHLLTQPLVNEDVRVHGKSNRQNNADNAWQRK